MDRGPRDVEVAGELGAALAGVRAKHELDGANEVNLDRLQDVEAALGVEFTDTELALFAAGLGEVVGLDLAKVIGLTGTIQAMGFPGDLIGLADLGGKTYLAMRRGADQRFLLLDGFRREQRAVQIAEFLGRFGEATGGTLKFRLVRPAPESTRSGRRVHHKVFGEGWLLSETGSGPTRKVKVDFPKLGLKLLQARFLEFLDE